MAQTTGTDPNTWKQIELSHLFITSMNLVTEKIFWAWWDDTIIYSLLTHSFFLFLNSHLVKFSIYFPENQRLWYIIHCHLNANDILLHFGILIVEVYGLDHQSAHRIILPSVSQMWLKISLFISWSGVQRVFFFYLFKLLIGAIYH